MTTILLLLMAVSLGWLGHALSTHVDEFLEQLDKVLHHDHPTL